jgi:hypothetical protein
MRSSYVASRPGRTLVLEASWAVFCSPCPEYHVKALQSNLDLPGGEQVISRTGRRPCPSMTVMGRSLPPTGCPRDLRTADKVRALSSAVGWGHRAAAVAGGDVR